MNSLKNPRFNLLAASLIFPPLYVLFFQTLDGIKKAPQSFKMCIAIFAISQIISASMTDTPLLSVATSLIRALFMAALFLYGYNYMVIKDIYRIYYSISLIGSFAIIYNMLQINIRGANFGQQSLEYFYISSNSISILGGISLILILLDKNGSIKYRTFCAAVSLVMVILGEGRSALFSLIFPIAYLYFSKKLAISPIVYVLLSLTLPLPFLTVMDISLRPIVWENAWNLIRQSPIHGVGSYRMGAYTDNSNLCSALKIFQDTFEHCPQWISYIGNPWIIAHNGLLHVLVESGAVGLFGWIFMWGLMINATHLRNPIYNSIILLLLPINLIDNSLLLPSAGYSEILFVFLGFTIKKNRDSDVPFWIYYPFLGSLVAIVFCILPLYTLTKSKVELDDSLIIFLKSDNGHRLIYYSLPQEFTNGKVMIKACSNAGICNPIAYKAYTRKSRNNWMNLPHVKEENMENLVLSVSLEKTPNSYKDIAEYKNDILVRINDKQGRISGLPCDEISMFPVDDYRVEWKDGFWSSPYPFMLYFKACKYTKLRFKTDYPIRKQYTSLKVVNYTKSMEIPLKKNSKDQEITFQEGDVILIYHRADLGMPINPPLSIFSTKFGR